MATMEPIAGETKKRVVSPTPLPTCVCSGGQNLTYGGHPSSATSLTLISVAFITGRDTRTPLAHTIPSQLASYMRCAHRMKPTRVRMTHALVMNYGLYKKMEIYVRRVSCLYHARL